MTEPTVIYAIKRASDGAIKIGRSRKLKAREKMLASEHGSLEVLFTHPVAAEKAHEIEQGAHALSFDYWLKDEWFRFPLVDIGIAAIKSADERVGRGEVIDCSRIRKARGQRSKDYIPDHVTPASFRAARELLGWTGSRVAAESGASLSAVRRFELTGLTSSLCIRFMVEALEKAGIEFIPRGVRLKDEPKSKES